MTKVLFIAYYFPPVGGAGVQRSQKFVQYLPAEGFAPVVVTGPGPAGGRWTPRDESLEVALPPKISVRRVKTPAPPEDGRLRRRLEYWLKVPSSFHQWWMKSAYEVALEAGAGAGLIFCTMSPFSTAAVGAALSRRLGIPWVADLRDPWALDEMQVYPTRLHRRWEAALMQRQLSTAALIVMNTPEAAKALVDSFPGLRSRKVVTITNGTDAADFTSDLPPRTDGKFRIVHSGYLHTETGLELRNRRWLRWLGGAEVGVDILTRSHTVLLDAVERWTLRRPEAARDLEILFAGVSSTHDQEFARRSSAAPLVRFAGYVPHERNLELVRTADLLFLPMHNLPHGRRSRIVPGKAYEYMASGRPVLAAVPDGDARDFLSRCGTALLCRPDDADGMVRILDRVYTAWRNGGASGCPDREFLSQFDRRKLTRDLASAFRCVLAGDERKALHTFRSLRPGCVQESQG
jgi:glycosyltransferase involved in cell wall biosynthesis